MHASSVIYKAPNCSLLINVNLWVSKGVYLQHSGSQLQAHQDRPVHQLRNPGISHLQGVLHQVCDIHLPVGSQHGDNLVSALCGGGVELCEHLDQGPLVLQGAASTHPAIVVFVVRVAVSSAPWKERNKYRVKLKLYRTEQ